jgi:DNA polymerase IIIc chi subunit
MSACIFHDTDASLSERRLFEIVEGAYAKREKIVVFAQTPERAHAIDRLLWIHKQEAFIPHEIFTGVALESAVRIAIVSSEMNPIGAGTLVVDGFCSLDFALGFASIHEFVNRSSPEMHEACRERFRAYRARQVQVSHAK